MSCQRCAGWLVPEWFTDVLDETGQIRCEGWRCINCGNIQEPLIIYHQTTALADVRRSRPRTRRLAKL
jgi:hypothetical protein